MTSLVAENVYKRYLTLQFVDATLTIDSERLENNLFFHIMMDRTEEDTTPVVLNVTISDFMPILHYLHGKRLKRGCITNFPAFFQTCEYIGESMLPSLVSTDSDFIQRFNMDIDDLIINDTEELVRALYEWMDEHRDGIEESREAFRESYIEAYKQDMYHTKLNEKSAGRLFERIQRTTIGSLAFPVTDIVSRPAMHYPTTMSYSDNDEPTTSDIRFAKTYLQDKFRKFPWKSETGGCLLLAGNSMSKYILKYNYRAEYDFFLVTRSSEEAERMIHAVSDWVKENSYDVEDSCPNNYFTIRSNRSITFVTIQGIICIHFSLFHSIEQVLIHFALDSYCIGFDGNECMTIPRGEKCLATRQILMVSWRQHRMMSSNIWCPIFIQKYTVAFPGVVPAERDRILEKRRLFYTLNREGRITYTILERIFYTDEVELDEYEKIKHLAFVYDYKSFTQFDYTPSIIMSYRRVVDETMKKVHDPHIEISDGFTGNINVIPVKMQRVENWLSGCGVP